MKRCEILSLACCVLLALPVMASGQDSTTAPPNIVFILADDQAWTDYGFMGHPLIQTPNLDALAARSAVFPRGHVPTALCRPSLATLITGLYAHQHKISGNDPSPALAAADSAEYAQLRERLISHIDAWPTLPKLLAQRGYLSHQSGKWWEGSYERGGFTHGMTRGFPSPGGRHGDDGLRIGREGLQPIFDFIDVAVAQQKPFYVWYAPFLPHAPHTPPERLLSKYRDKVESLHVAKYYAMCEWFDETCGELIGYVDRKGLTNNTLFVYIGDNGWIQDPQSPNYALRSKQSPNEGGVRQPILLSWPGVITPGTRDELVSSIDLVPTILGAAGVEIPRNLPGVDLLPVVRDGRQLVRDTIFGEGFAHDVADLDKPEATLLYRWAIEDRWKLILTYDGAVGRYAGSHPRTERRPQLYDLSSDPHEEQNVAAEHPDIVQRLADKIATWWPVTERQTITHWAETITLKEAWVLSAAGGGRGRISLPADQLEAAWLEGKLALPDRTLDASPSADGLAPWTRVRPDEKGVFANYGPPNAWLAAFVASPADREQVWLLDAQGHSSVRVNDVPRCGDIYSNGSVELPVLLQPGTNSLVFIGSRGRIAAKLRRPDKPVFLSDRDTTFPHVVRGETESLRAAVLLVNATDQTQSGLTLKATGPGFQSTETTLPTLVPLSVRKIGFRIEPDPTTANEAWKADHVSVDLELTEGSADQRMTIDRMSVRWDVRDATQTHRRTFVSDIDGSVQYYGVVPPVAGSLDASKRPGLVLSLHGAGVEAEGQANVYAPKPNLYVITPTNRRNFGFDWEDWGRWDALEVLAEAEARFHTDPQRTYLTGHSMGGHGTWHIGTLFPDRFAAIGPSAGWISFSTYAGGQGRATDDPISQMLRRGITASDTFSRILNLAYPGVFILHGDQDDNVPVEQARTMREQLAKFHPDFVYKEQPGAGHWWGNACCDWPAMFTFFADHQLPPPGSVTRINFATPSPSVSPHCFWATVAAQVQQGQISRVNLQLDRDARTVSGTTENVSRLALQLDALRASQAEPAALTTLTIELDGAKLSEVPLEQKSELWLEKQDAGWQPIAEPSASEKGPRRGGPLKDAFRNRFLLVYGTQGTPEENAWMLARARFDAETFWYRGNGSVDVVDDTQWKTIAEIDRNVIVYGNATVNSAWRELLADSPVAVTRGQWQATSEPPRDGSAVVWMVRPRPGSAVAAVAAIGGSDVKAMRASNRPAIFSSGTGYPDLIIATPDYLTRGAQAVLLAGYFGHDWSFEKGEWARQ